MKKEDKIKEAYGKYWEEMKPFIDEDGWFNKNAFYQKEFIFYEKIGHLFTHKDDLMMPISIKGIEDNLGWIKIESENDLPKERGSFWTFIEGKEVVMNTFNTFDDMEFTFDNGHITHYKPLIKPNNPLY
jgi:hypothetical protein